jgi:hypothetical protein
MAVPCRRDLACYRNDGHDGDCMYPSRYTPPCQWDLACVRDAGHDGDHLYPTPDTTALEEPTP